MTPHSSRRSESRLAAGHSLSRSEKRRRFNRLLVETLEPRLALASDFGDAPAPYPVLLAENGAVHTVGTLQLGANVDSEADGAHSANADADDTTGVPGDEDGVCVCPMSVGQLGATVTVNVQGAAGKLDAWIDFNGDGSWGGPGEQILDSRSVAVGDNVLAFDVPNFAQAGTTYARFRLSTAGDLGVDGVAADGEVEDYEVSILAPLGASGTFTSQNTISATANGATSVFAADVDGDGDADILSASANDDKIAWYENNGSQSFTFHLITTTADSARSVFAADVDGDGDVDVLSASYNDDTIAWYENDGSESFTPHNISTTADGAVSVFAADLDGDGDIDVLSASSTNDTIAWYENDGSESFTRHAISTAADAAFSVFAADVDSDGDMDVLSASLFDDKIAWYENDGSESFTAHTITTAADNARSVFATDLDQDGDLDVLSASFNDNKIAWYENDGSENFTPHTITTEAGEAFSVFATDLDGDSDQDVLSASGGNISWYENDGSENFVPHVISILGEARSILAADVDGDGDLDVLSASFPDDKIAWYEHLGNDYGDAPAPYPTTNAEDGARHRVFGPRLGANRVVEADGTHSATASFDDLNGEDGVTFGNLFVGQLAATVTVNVQDAPGKLDAWIDFDGDGSWDDPGEQIFASQDVVVGDNNLTFDVPSDAVAGITFARFRLSTAGFLAPEGAAADGEVEDYQVSILSPTASGLFGGQNTISIGADGATSVIAADMDGDGDLDVLSASRNDDKIAWYENNGSETFTPHTITTAADPASVFAADLDGDGDLDVLSTSVYHGSIAWYENDGSENFTQHSLSFSGNLDGPRSVIAADVDGDNDLDLLTASANDSQIAWIENDGSENFTLHTITTSASWAVSVATADVDGDGDLDVLSASFEDDKVAWYENDGSENFTPHTITTAADSVRSVFAADVDDDGDIDVLSASFGDSKIAWYENDGNENFTSHTISTAANGAAWVIAADVEGDGDLDVLSASLNDDKVAWYENDGSENFTPHTITTAADSARSVFAADVDGDGDLDVLSASYFDDKIAWYENLDSDYGDAPAPYPTTDAENGARHKAIGPTLGATRDPDALVTAAGSEATGTVTIDGHEYRITATPSQGSGFHNIDVDIVKNASDHAARATVLFHNTFFRLQADSDTTFNNTQVVVQKASSYATADDVRITDGANTVSLGITALNNGAAQGDSTVNITVQEVAGASGANYVTSTKTLVISLNNADNAVTGADLVTLIESATVNGAAAGSQAFDATANDANVLDITAGDAALGVGGDQTLMRSDVTASYSAGTNVLTITFNDEAAIVTAEQILQAVEVSTGNNFNNGDSTFLSGLLNITVAQVNVNNTYGPLVRPNVIADYSTTSADDLTINFDSLNGSINFADVITAIDGLPEFSGTTSTPASGTINGTSLTAVNDATRLQRIDGTHGPHSANANFDDLNGITPDDEDGVTFGTMIVGQLAATVTVNVQGGPGKLDAWIDLNGDGSWGGPGEQIFDSLDVVVGDNVLTFDVANFAQAGTTYARFRLSTAGALAPQGAAVDGEVEDYQLTINNPAAASGVFGAQKTISTIDGAASLFAADVDGDGDLDVLSGSTNIVWHENNGSENFTRHIISTERATSVFAADVDGDGDLDVVSAWSNEILWHENDGSENFTPHTISTLPDNAHSVFAADVDGDGDTDVLSASYHDNMIAWYENDGSENFLHHTISTTAIIATSVFAADVDGDGDMDALSASRADNKIAWYENDGSENFTPHTISTNAIWGRSVFAADVDGDGDTDVLSASRTDNKIAWYENDGSENFTPHNVSTAVSDAYSVFAADVDGDGDTDVLSASHQAQITWHENDGSENFTPRIISNNATLARSAIAADVDSDGDLDVLSSSHGKIAWYENDDENLLVADKVGVKRGNQFREDANDNSQWNGPLGGDWLLLFGATSDVPLAGDWNGDGYDEIGVQRGNQYYLDRNGNGVWDGTAGGDRLYTFRNVGDKPLVGDWDGDGDDEIGAWNAGIFYFDRNSNGVWDGSGAGDRELAFGLATDTPVDGDWDGDGDDQIGVRRGDKFFLDVNGNGGWEGTPTDRQLAFGDSGDIPVIGDWDRDGLDQVGVRRNNTYYLDADGSGHFAGTAGGDREFVFGVSSDIPLIGRWRPNPLTVTGNDKLGVRRQTTVFQDANGNGDLETAAEGDRVVNFGVASDVGIAGDWTSDDSFDEVGVQRGNQYYLDSNGNGGFESGGGDDSITFRNVGDKPLVGDWDGDGDDQIGSWRSGTFYLDRNSNGAWDGAAFGDRQIAFGPTTAAIPLAGDWNGDGDDDVGVYLGKVFYLDANGNGDWDDVAGGDRRIPFGISGDTPVTGDWNGDGTDDVGVKRNNAYYLDANGNGAWNGLAGGDLEYVYGLASDQPLPANWRPVSALMAAGGSASASGDAAPLTADELAPILQQAIILWAKTGLTSSQLQTLGSVQVGIVDLPGAQLGQSLGGTILIDRDAAGYGWFVDSESEIPDPEAMDLLSAVLHELGHELGLDHDDDVEAMFATLAAGTRRQL